MESIFTKYNIYEYFDDGKGIGYNGGDHLKDAVETPWKTDTSKQRRISCYETGKDYAQMRDGTIHKLFHVDWWEVKGKEKIKIGTTSCHVTLDEAKKACKKMLEENPRGRKRNYIDYVVREDS